MDHPALKKYSLGMFKLMSDMNILTINKKLQKIDKKIDKISKYNSAIVCVSTDNYLFTLVPVKPSFVANYVLHNIHWKFGLTERVTTYNHKDGDRLAHLYTYKLGVKKSKTLEKHTLNILKVNKKLINLLQDLLTELHVLISLEEELGDFYGLDDNLTLIFLVNIREEIKEKYPQKILLAHHTKIRVKKISAKINRIARIHKYVRRVTT